MKKSIFDWLLVFVANLKKILYLVGLDHVFPMVGKIAKNLKETMATLRSPGLKVKLLVGYTKNPTKLKGAKRIRLT